VWTALWLVYVVWGSTYLAIAYAVESLPPLLSAGARFAAAAVLLGAWVLVRRGRAAFGASRREVASAAVVGLLLLLGGNGLVTIAENAHLPSGLTALLVAVIPLYVVVLRAFTGDRPGWRTVAGVAVGFVGLAVLLLPGARPSGVAAGAAATVLAASLLWSLGSFYASRTRLPADPLVTTAVEMAAGAVGLGVVGTARGEHLVLGRVSASSWIALLYLVLFGSIVAFTAYSWLLGVAPVSKVSTYAYVNPVVAVALGALFRHEPVTAVTVAGGALTVLAVAIVVREEGRRPAVAPSRVEPEPSAVPAARRD
jgi:drug/metabolite transporter (DMT)-like permease